MLAREYGGSYMSLPQWIVTDLDETLLHNDRSISKRTLDTIGAVRSLGIRFAIATTRSHSYAQQFIDILKPDAMALSGGAVAFHNESLQYHMPLDAHLVTFLLTEFSHHEHVQDWVLDTADGRFTPENIASTPAEYAVYSMFLWTEHSHADYLSEKYHDTVTVTALWEPNMYRLSHKEATKLAALQALLDGVSPTDVICFGDDLMDVGMLSHFTGVAVSNAKREAKEAATHVTYSNEEDGVAQWLEQNLLRKLP